MLSFKQIESTYSKKEPCEQYCTWIIKFSHWVLDTINMVLTFSQFKLKMAVHAAQTKKKICDDVNNSWYFLRRVNFISVFFQEGLASLLIAGKPISDNLED